MNHFLIDFENVGSEGLKNLNGIQDGDEILIFYSDNRRNVALDVEVFTEIFGKNITCQGFKVVVGSKNALDFQLSSYLGCLIGKNTRDEKYRNIAQKVELLTGKNLVSKSEDCYFIVSNDKGYDCLCRFWKKRSVKVEKIETKGKQSETDEKPKEAKVESSSGVATLEEIKAVVSDKDLPLEVCKIFNKHKTNCDIHNGLVKLYQDAKRGSRVYKQVKPLIKEKKK